MESFAFSDSDHALLQLLRQRPHGPISIGSVQRVGKLGYRAACDAVARFERSGMLRRNPGDQDWCLQPDANTAAAVAGPAQARFLNGLSDQWHLLRNARAAVAVELAPDFFSFDLFRPDENRLSEIIAALLDPRGTHAQGSAFLQAFVEAMGLPLQADWSRATVHLERRTDYLEARSHRRMDIEVSLDTMGFAIENKPSARDQTQQLSDYLAHLQRRYPGSGCCCLLYLSGFRGGRPAEHSLPRADTDRHVADGTLVLGDYEGLARWLQRCHEICKSHQVRAFVQEFLRYCQKTFLGIRDMQDHETLFGYLCRTPEQARTGMELLFSREAIQAKLLEKFGKELRQALELDTHGLELRLNAQGGRGFVVIKRSHWKCHAIVFEFDDGAWNKLCFGIGSEKQGLVQREIFDAIEAVAVAQPFPNCAPGRHSAWWSWYSTLLDFPNWNGHPGAWANLATGAMAQTFATLALRLVHDAGNTIEKYENA